ncbi:MAG: AEC family transporter [Nanoarchaeota archaeon]|nr:AEC family transporter [Nanoarchaeota archaeon]MBU1703797.1 AEC family transporter [Nanoarchaeota archaeon]
MLEIINVVLPVFLIIAVGFFVGKKTKVNVQPVVDLIIYIAGPALIFSSMSTADVAMDDFLRIILSAAGVIALLVAVTFIYLKLSKDKRKGIYLPIATGNTGYLGFPVALFAFGMAGLSQAIIFDIVNGLFLFSFGIYIVHKKKELKEMFRTPLLYAVIIGLLFNIFSIKTPEVLFKPIEMIGMITIPAALLVLGYRLTEIRIKSLKAAVSVSLFRIVGGFLSALLIVTVFSISGLARQVILVQASMPSAVFTMILCQKYHRDAALVASVVFISTIISLVTLPLVLWFVL